MAGKKAYTADQLLKMLKFANRKLGKSPSTKDLPKLGLPKSDTFKSYFPAAQNWNDILKLANISPLSDRYSNHWA